MKAMLDSSVLIAAMLPDHIHHLVAVPWLSTAKAGIFQFAVAGHSLVEVYSVLTRMPRTPKITSSEAWEMLRDNVISVAQIISLQDQDYPALLSELASLAVTGGAVYDGIIAKAAELAQVDQLVTLNDQDFQRVWPAGIGRIVSPLVNSPP